jgi:AcrR family transcriptional regulator
MLPLSTPWRTLETMPRAVSLSRPTRSRKRADRYHHGDLANALVQEAVRMIHRDGVSALTLRAVGARLGVSRTALYRHYADKAALLEAVSREGFRLFRQTLYDAWDGAGRGMAGFEATGEAYVRFALEHPSHYRVMFGGDAVGHRDPRTAEDAAAAFQVLIDNLVELQGEGRIPPGEDLAYLGHYIWATVHGVAMLALDGRLSGRVETDELTRYTVARLRGGLATPMAD